MIIPKIHMSGRKTATRQPGSHSHRDKLSTLLFALRPQHRGLDQLRKSLVWVNRTVCHLELQDGSVSQLSGRWDVVSYLEQEALLLKPRAPRGAARISRFVVLHRLRRLASFLQSTRRKDFLPDIHKHRLF